MQHRSLHHRTLLSSSSVDVDVIFFFLWFHFVILSVVISPLFSSSVLGIYRPEEFIFQCHIFLLFHTVHGVLNARILKWFAIPFSSGPRFVRNLSSTFRKLNHSIWFHHFMANRWGNSENSGRLYLFGSKIIADGDCSHEIKRRLPLGRKTMTNLAY